MIAPKDDLTKIYHGFVCKVPLNFSVGKFDVRTIREQDGLSRAFKLRYQVFKANFLHGNCLDGEEFDRYDLSCDHLGVFDKSTGEIVATCRLNCSLFSNQFYSEEEFYCDEIVQRPETKIEIGRVCVKPEFRRGVIVMLIWKAIAQYMEATKSSMLFGCGSIMTLDPGLAVVVYQYLHEESKIQTAIKVTPKESFQCLEFEELMRNRTHLNSAEKHAAKQMLPALCKSYFDMGCFATGFPAFDREFRCIDFLTVLEKQNLSPKIRQRLF